MVHLWESGTVEKTVGRMELNLVELKGQMWVGSLELNLVELTVRKLVDKMADQTANHWVVMLVFPMGNLLAAEMGPHLVARMVALMAAMLVAMKGRN